MTEEAGIHIRLSSGYEVEIAGGPPDELEEGIEHLLRAIVGEHITAAPTPAESWDELIPAFCERMMREINHVVDEQLEDTGFFLKLVLHHLCWKEFCSIMDSLRKAAASDEHDDEQRHDPETLSFTGMTMSDVVREWHEIDEGVPAEGKPCYLCKRKEGEKTAVVATGSGDEEPRISSPELRVSWVAPLGSKGSKRLLFPLCQECMLLLGLCR